jgi:hypothetical protein
MPNTMLAILAGVSWRMVLIARFCACPWSRHQVRVGVCPVFIGSLRRPHAPSRLQAYRRGRLLEPPLAGGVDCGI